MNIFHLIENAITKSTEFLPLEISSLLGGFIEEVVAPIPSSFVMITLGSVAFARSKGWFFLLWLSFLGSVGKTFGAWIIYYLADKLEDIIVGKFGRYLGVSHQEVEDIGKRFKGGWKDTFVLFLLRATPVVPSAAISVVSGLIKINLRMYLVATLAGNVFRCLIYIYIGYAGISAYQSLLSGFDSFKSIIQFLLFLLLTGSFGWLYYKRKRKARLK